MRTSRYMALMVVAVACGAIGPASRPTTGPAAVATAHLVLHDAGRAKELRVAVVYPAAIAEGARLPVVVISHGAGSSGDRMESLARAWAERGYVCLSPTHADSVTLSAARGGAVLKAGAELWEGRAKDVGFVIDAAAGGEVGRQVAALAGHLDEDRVAVVGHGLGALTAGLVAGVRPVWNGQERDLRDPRVKTAVLLAATDAGVGLGEGSFGHLAVPTLVVTGTAERPAGGGRRVFEALPAGDKYLLTLKGADAAALLAAVTRNAEQRRIGEACQGVTRCFLDAYLQRDEAARDLMLSGSVVAPYVQVGSVEGK